jgi:ubiquinone/menaquinone biosynthesis C-methylase UbiE
MMKTNNVFDKNGLEFDKWANIDGLKIQEKYLIEKYFNLDPSKKTVEAGSAGGRILLGMHKLGYSSLTGFDCIPAMIEVANQRKGDADICFEVQDAVKLAYQDNSFDRAIYFMQILSLLEDESDRVNAWKEIARILKPGGYVLVSVLCFECRMKEKFYRLLSSYLNILRKITGSNRSIQSMPWLKHQNKPNWTAFLDRGDMLYSYKIDELYHLFDDLKLEVVGIGTDRQLRQSKIYNTKADLMQDELEGQLFVVCKKPG